MTAPTPETFADGIYFGLLEEPYHADSALGSTDLKALATDPAAWWWSSGYNPLRPEQDEDAAHRILGRAAHKFVLEGPAAFQALYDRAPDGDDLLRTSDDLGKWLKEATKANAEAMKAIALSPAIAATKAARIHQVADLCAQLDLAPPRILDVIEQQAVLDGLQLLKPADHDRIVQAGSAVLANPHLAGSFQGGMPEVSVFWTDETAGAPVRRKARFDYLKTRAVVDLKSTRPKAGLDFVASCRRALAEWNYPAQAAGYLDGRAQVARLVAEGRVYGDHDPAWLRGVAAAPSYAFVFVFWASVGAPLTWGGVISPGETLALTGHEYVRRGLEHFIAHRDEFGLDQPWLSHSPLAEIELEDLPRWYANTF